MNLDLAGKVVVVTGASGGIGSTIARQFLEQGCKVALLARDKDRLEGTSNKLRSDFDPKNVVSISVDCGIEKHLNDAISEIKNAWSKIDIAVANIGDGRSEQIAIPSSKSFKNAFETNFETAVNLARATQNELCKTRGNLLFISSIAGLEVTGAPTDYSIAKAALIMLSKQLSQKLAPEIRVNCIAPGNIFFTGGRWEELLKSNGESIDAMIKDSVPLQRFGTPEDVANAAVFLCSPLAAFITGACLTIDGGQTVASR
jgi:3-oxoacyl-[acyl-carrier protein] reductase